MCDKCNNINPCACNEPTFCGCSTKLDLLCTYYSGETLEPMGIKEGMDGTQVISKINEYVKNILQNLDISPTVIESVGNGVHVYKGLSAGTIDEFKSLVGNTGIDITPEEDMVRFTINQDWLESIIIQVIEDNGGNSNLELLWSSLEIPGNPNANPENWHTPSLTTDIWLAIRNTDNSGEGVWNIVKTKGEKGDKGDKGEKGESGESTQGTPGQATMNANVFKRAETQPETPTGGTFLSPTPSGWSDGIPPANGNAAWMSTRIFTSDGQAPQQPTWSEPSLVADTASIDYEFSSFTGTSPGTPTQPLNGATWHNIGTEDDIWMAFRAVNNGAYGVWSVVRIKGEQGPPGEAGSGFSVVSSNPMQSVAVGSDSTTSSALSYLVSLSVYNNAVQMFSTNDTVLADDQYRIELPTSPYSGVTVVKENSSILRFNIANGTVFPDTSITSLIDITVGSANTVLKSSFTIIPIKTAEDATSLSLSVDSNVVKFDGFGNLVTPTSIYASAVQQNYTEAITWSSVPVGLVTGTGTAKTLNTAELFAEGNTSVKIKVTTPNGLTDETTIIRVADGAGGAPGINGTTGPTPRLLELVNGGEYENGQDFIDYAYYRSNDANEGWYTVKVVGGVRTVVTYTGGVPSLSVWNKAPFTKEMSFGTVVAEQANLAGFIFRNQILNSQAVGTTASCHPTPGVQLPNLSLNGLEGIIKFLDRMVLDRNGITLKDDCGRPRMIFRWENGMPALKFLSETGVVTWEAGQNGYVYITTGSQPSTWENTRLTKLDSLNSYPVDSDITTIDAQTGQRVLQASVVANISELLSIYEISQISCDATPITLSTPYRLIYSQTAFSNPGGATSYVGHKFIKGDMAVDINKYTAIYLSPTAIDSDQVATAPVGTFPPNGWYMIEGISGYERNHSIICSATKGVYPMFEIYETNPDEYQVHGYANIAIVYLHNGNILRTEDILEAASWNRV